MYYFQNERGHAYVGINLPLESPTSFENFLVDFAEKRNGSIDIQRESGLNYTADDDVALGWDDSRVIFLVAEDRSSSRMIISQLRSQFGLLPSESLTSIPSFQNFNDQDMMLAFWGNVDMLSTWQDIAITKPSHLTEPLTVMGFLTMTNDALTLRAEISPEVNLMEMVTGFDLMGTNFDADGMKLVPRYSYIVCGYAMNPSAMYDYLRSEGVLGDMRYELESGLGWSLEHTRDSMNGSMIVALTKFTPKQYYNYYLEEYVESDDLEPVLSVIMGFKSARALENIINSSSENLKAISDRVYEARISGVPIYLAAIGNQLVISSHYSGVQDYADGTYESDSYDDPGMTRSSENGSQFVHVNLDYEEYPAQIRDELRLMDIDRASMAVINQFAKRAEITFENTGAIKLTLRKNP